MDSSKDEPRILIIDDTPDRLDLMSVQLSHAGYQLLTADSAQEGYGRAQRELPDLIVSDVAMPYTDGIELCRMIRSDAELSATPMLLVSAHRKDTASAVAGLEAGADDYLEAPYDPERLIAKAARLIEQGRASKALRESEARFRLMADTAPVMIWMAGTDKLCDYFNKVWLEFTGRTMEQELGDGWAEGVHPDDFERCMETYARSFDARAPFKMEYRLRRFDKEYRWVMDTGTPRFSPDGSFLGYIGSCVDITEQKQTEERMTRLNEELEQRVAERTAQLRTLNRELETEIAERQQAEEQLRLAQKLESLGRLAGGIAHDFNNLLTAINGYSDLLLMQIDTDNPIRHKVEEIRKAGDRAASLTYQLLAFSRKQILQPQVLNINSVISETIKLLHRLIGEDVQLRTVLAPEVGSVLADPGQLSQMLLNLAVNARDAMPQGGKLTIETTNVYLDEGYASLHVAVRPGHYVLLAVSDTGIGMNEETQARIFEPFFTTKEVGKGTGLGLSTVYGIVKQSGGNIWVYSEVRHGTTFKIYLPLVEEEAESAEAVSEDKELPRGTEKVLLVEDNDAVRATAREILSLCGYEVMEVANGAWALALCEQSDCSPDLLITDVVMPEMGGKELATRLLQLRPQMRVLYMSGYTENAIVHHGVLYKGINFIQKPFTPKALACKVREVLDAV